MRRQFINLYLWLISGILLSIFIVQGVTLFAFGDAENQMFQNQIAAYRNLAIDTANGDQLVQRAHMQQLAKTMGASINPAFPDELAANEIQLLSQEGLLVIDYEDALSYFTLPGSDDIYRLQYRDDNLLLEQDRRSADFVFHALLLTPALVIGLWLYSLNRKLSALEHAAKSISEGDLGARAPTDKRRQIGNLNRNFNLMAQCIEQLIRSHKQLTNAVAHELRSPIFRLQCQLDMLIECKDQQEKNQYIEGIGDDIQELGELVEEMLHYARMENAEVTANFQQQDLSIWLHKLVNHVQLESPVPINYPQPAQPLIVAYDAHLLQRAILNLIRNATRYAQNTIQVDAYSNGETTCITVDDDGNGIPQSQREEIFKPFYRLSAARDRADGGHGLGLSIVQHIIQLHGGTIAAEESPLSGARFVITLPKTRTTS